MTGKDMVRIALDWRAQGRELAIATVIRVGSGRKSFSDNSGAQLIVDSEGRFDGALPCDIPAGEVIAKAQKIIKNGKPEILEFTGDPNAPGRRNCARIRVYVEPFAPL